MLSGSGTVAEGGGGFFIAETRDRQHKNLTLIPLQS